jgi:hypothetical protein
MRAGDVRPRRSTVRPAALGAVLLLLCLRSARADVFILITGDRITGKPVLTGKRAITVQTPFGRLVIPRARIERIIKPDGTEEVVSGPAIVAATPEPPPRLAPRSRSRLVLVVQGQTFFYGWDNKDAGKVDPSLRLEIRLDEETTASWVDAKPDPDEVKGALMNTFSFATEDVAAFAGRGVELSPAEVQPGRATLKIGLPPESAHRRLRLSYQINEGDKEHPAWRDLAQAATDVELRPDERVVVQVRQDRGRMEFSGLTRKRMKNVETFHIELQPE